MDRGCLSTFSQIASQMSDEIAGLLSFQLFRNRPLIPTLSFLGLTIKSQKDQMITERVKTPPNKCLMTKQFVCKNFFYKKNFSPMFRFQSLQDGQGLNTLRYVVVQKKSRKYHYSQINLIEKVLSEKAGQFKYQQQYYVALVLL